MLAGTEEFRNRIAGSRQRKPEPQKGVGVECCQKCCTEQGLSKKGKLFIVGSGSGTTSRNGLTGFTRGILVSGK